MAIATRHHLAHRSTSQLVLAVAAALHGVTLGGSALAEGKGTRVKPGQATRVFVMAGFTPDCAFKGYPVIAIDTAPAKGNVETSEGADTTIQYSLSGKCVGTSVKGTAILYRPAPGATGEDTFTISGRLGTGEPATRTFSVIIDENGAAQ